MPSQVHRGFLTAYDSVKGRVMSIVDEVLDDGTSERWQIHVTGHSLGGALATICAFELVARRYRVISETTEQPDEVMPHDRSSTTGNRTVHMDQAVRHASIGRSSAAMHIQVTTTDVLLLHAAGIAPPAPSRTSTWSTLGRRASAMLRSPPFSTDWCRTPGG